MLKIIVVEDSSMVTKVVRHVMNNNPNIDAHYAATMQEAVDLYNVHSGDLFGAVCDLNLPDAPNGEVVDFFLDKGIPSLVLTASYDETKREFLLAKGIVDYVVKEGRYSYEYVAEMVERLGSNCHIKVMVVEDSSSLRKFIAGMLRQHMYQVYEASNGVEALSVFDENPDIKLIISDYQMPEMNGVELVKALRARYEKNDLVIIGLSAEDKGALSARFIKNGANDFLRKPFYHEELQCRVHHCLSELAFKQRMWEAANKDFLTNLNNRRYFFERGRELHLNAMKNGSPLSLALMDIDHFKNVNDSYGHDAGDTVLMEFSRHLSESFGRFLVARTGGEEFCVLLPGVTANQAVQLMDGFRQLIEDAIFDVRDELIPIRVSIGVTGQMENNLDGQIRMADENLYRAKDAGRNIVIGD